MARPDAPAAPARGWRRIAAGRRESVSAVRSLSLARCRHRTRLGEWDVADGPSAVALLTEWIVRASARLSTALPTVALTLRIAPSCGFVELVVHQPGENAADHPPAPTERRQRPSEGAPDDGSEGRKYWPGQGRRGGLRRRRGGPPGAIMGAGGWSAAFSPGWCTTSSTNPQEGAIRKGQGDGSDPLGAVGGAETRPVRRPDGAGRAGNGGWR